ncbi:MAG: hypothetical protein QXH03_02675 [Candidatus Bathyarchaeia archaeon]
MQSFRFTVSYSPTILVSRPDFETATKWGAYWYNENVVKPAQEKGFKVIDLYAKDAVREKFHQAIDTEDPIYISAVGHGNQNTLTGQNYSVLLRVDDAETAKRVPNRHFHLLSCETGAQLGPWMVEKGAVAYHGYKVTYYFVISTFPDSYAKPFFDSDETIDRVLFEGKTHREANKAAYDKYTQYIEDPNTPEICKRYLLWDRDGLVFYGNPDATITAPPPPPRRGQPSEATKQVKVKPMPPPESTTLTVETDKDEYISGETITIAGKLTFTSDGAPLPNREIKICINGQEVAKAITDSQGNYKATAKAPEVKEETTITVKATFAGDQ